MSQPSRWSVLVLRGWVEAGGLRVRLLRTDSGGRRHLAVSASAADAARITEAWLDELADGPADGPVDASGDRTTTGRRRRRGRRLPRFGWRA